MRILFLTQWFQPEPFFKGLPFALSLKEKGHEVEVLTGFPNYPGGRVYPGYRVRLYQRETLEGITVHRIPLYPSHDKSAFRRILNYISFSISTLLLGVWLVKKPDVIYVYNLITLAPTAFLLRLVFGAKVVIDVQDLWPESVASTGMLTNSILLRLLDAICNWAYRSADRVIVLSQGFERVLKQRGVNPLKIDVIYNWCDEDGLMSREQSLSLNPYERDRMRGKFNLLFAGTMGIAQGLDTIVECAKLCAKHLPDVQFVFVGAGVDKERIEKEVGEINLENVLFLPPRPLKEMAPIYALASVALVHLKRDPLFEITIPSKIQACLFMGRPILISVPGDAAEMIANSGAGSVCTPDDPSAMAESIKALHKLTEAERERMGEAGRSFYTKFLSRECGVNRFEKVLSSL